MEENKRCRNAIAGLRGRLGPTRASWEHMDGTCLKSFIFHGSKFCNFGSAAPAGSRRTFLRPVVSGVSRDHACLVFEFDRDALDNLRRAILSPTSQPRVGKQLLGIPARQVTH